MAVKAIPKKLLQDAAIQKPYLGDSGRGETFGAEVELSNVRIEVGSVEIKDLGGTIIAGLAILFYDRTNSSPLNIVFNKRDEIIFEGETYIVSEIFKGKAFNRHHDEVILK